MKKLEWAALLGVVVILAARLGHSLLWGTIHGTTLMDAAMRDPQLFRMISHLMMAQGMVTLLVHIAVAVWLYHETKTNQSRPWIWSVFGFLFGLAAAAFFVFSEIFRRRVDAPRAAMP